MELSLNLILAFPTYCRKCIFTELKALEKSKIDAFYKGSYIDFSSKEVKSHEHEHIFTFKCYLDVKCRHTLCLQRMTFFELLLEIKPVLFFAGGRVDVVAVSMRKNESTV